MSANRVRAEVGGSVRMTRLIHLGHRPSTYLTLTPDSCVHRTNTLLPRIVRVATLLTDDGCVDYVGWFSPFDDGHIYFLLRSR
jgi:hypothetical protein